MHFFKNWITTASDRKDLKPRQSFKFFRFFASDTNCLQTVPSKTDPSLLWEDPNPRNTEKSFFRNKSNDTRKGSEPTKTKYWPAEDKEKATDHKTRGKNFFLIDRLEFNFRISATIREQHWMILLYSRQKCLKNKQSKTPSFRNGARAFWQRAVWEIMPPFSFLPFESFQSIAKGYRQK